MYHAAPNAQGLFALALGIELTIMPRFTPEEFLALIETQGITHAQVVPTMFVRLLELPDEVRARLRPQLARVRRPRRGAVPRPRQETDDRMVRAGDLRVLRRHRDRDRRRLRQPRMARSRGHRRKAARGRGHPCVRPRGRTAATRRHRRDIHPPARILARLHLSGPGGPPPRRRTRRLHHDRGRRPTRRGRLPAPVRPRARHGHLRRGQHLSHPRSRPACSSSRASATWPWSGSPTTTSARPSPPTSTPSRLPG